MWCCFAYTDIKQLFGRPQAEAANAFGVSITTMKQICRHFGVDRWPYQRGRRAISHLLSTSSLQLGSADESAPPACSAADDGSTSADHTVIEGSLDTFQDCEDNRVKLSASSTATPPDGSVNGAAPTELAQSEVATEWPPKPTSHGIGNEMACQKFTNAASAISTTACVSRNGGLDALTRCHVNTEENVNAEETWTSTYSNAHSASGIFCSGGELSGSAQAVLLPGGYARYDEPSCAANDLDLDDGADNSLGWLVSHCCEGVTESWAFDRDVSSGASFESSVGNNLMLMGTHLMASQHHADNDASYSMTM